MKIKPEHVAYMRAAMQDQLKDKEAIRRAIIADGRYKDLDKRLRWDMCYKAGITAWICKTIYPYANDSHIDTALRVIVEG